MDAANSGPPRSAPGRHGTNGGHGMRRIVIASLLLALGCGEGDPTATDVRTRSGPTQFAGKYAVFFQYDAWVSSISATLDGDGGTTGDTGGGLDEAMPITAFDLYVMDAPWSCSSLDGGPQPARDVAEVIWSISRPKPRPITAGEYPFGGTDLATADSSNGNYLDSRPECLAQWTAVTGGSVTLSRVSETEARGAMSALLHDGTLIEGDFVATRCPAVFPAWPDGGVPEPFPRCEGSVARAPQR